MRFNWETVISMNIAGGLVGFLFGGFTEVMLVLLTLNVVDIISGLLVGRKKEDLGSKAFITGIKKKVAMWSLVIVANMIDTIAFNHTPVAKTGLLFVLIANEGISITENAALLGLPVPESIKGYLVQIKAKGEDTQKKQGE